MIHVVSCGAVLLIALLAFAATSRRWPARDRLVGWLCWAGHVAASFAMLWIIENLYGGIGDAMSYLRQGELLAEYARIDLVDHVPQLVSLVVRGAPALPFDLPSIGSSTSAMAGLAGLMMLVLDSIWAANLAMSMLAFGGQVALFLAIARLLPLEARSRIAPAMLLLPSVVFWSSGVQKEAVVMWGLGGLVFALTELRAQVIGRAALLGIPSVTAIMLVKPYVLFPLVLAVGAWIYLQRTGQERRVRPAVLVAGIAVGVGGVILLGRLFPEYSVESLGELAALQRSYGTQVGGGSFVEVVDPEERSLLGQLTFAPFALLTTLFRPVIFEASNATMLMSALETTLLAALAIRLPFAVGLRESLRRLRYSPTLSAAAVFVVLLALGVGLSTTNLGTASRYRIPLMPLFATILLVLGTKRVAVKRQRSSAPPIKRSHRSTMASTE